MPHGYREGVKQNKLFSGHVRYQGNQGGGSTPLQLKNHENEAEYPYPVIEIMAKYEVNFYCKYEAKCVAKNMNDLDI